MGELIDRKEHNRVEMAEYMTAKKIDDEAALLWWIPYISYLDLGSQEDS